MSCQSVAVLQSRFCAVQSSQLFFSQSCAFDYFLSSFRLVLRDFVNSLGYLIYNIMEHRVSADQLDELLQHLITHPNLAKGVGVGPRSKDNIDREWNDLAARLNAHAGGATKTGQRWKRYWADLKFKTKSRAVLRRREASDTGAEPDTLEQLSETEQKILTIIGPEAVYSDTHHRMPAFIQQMTVGSRDIRPRRSLESSIVRQPRVFRSQNGSRVTRTAVRTGQRVGPSWLVELEQRRVEAEVKLADAAIVAAEAARTQAEAARTQAEASLAVAQTLHEHTVMVNKLFDIFSNK